jgi:hypothetical protein
MIIPQFFIGSGIVEFEDTVEHSLNKINHKLFNLLVLLAIISLTHLGYKLIFAKDDQIEKKKNNKI